MKNKHFLIGLFLLFALHIIHIKSYGQQTSPCNTSLLDLGTAVNHETGTYYAINTPDNYWVINGATSEFQNYTIPICATAWGGGANLVSGAGKSNPISIANHWTNSDGNMKNGALNNCNTYGNAYVFERKFKVSQTATGNLNIVYSADDFIEHCSLILPNGSAFPLQNKQCGSSSAAVAFNLSGLTFTPGVYTLHFEIYNDYVTWNNSNHPSKMMFELRGSVSTPLSNALVDNLHFGKWTKADHPNYCAAPYIPLAFSVSPNPYCIVPPATTTKLIIRDFYSLPGENTYTLTGPTAATFGEISTAKDTCTIVLGVGQYLMTATDKYGCKHIETIVATTGAYCGYYPSIRHCTVYLLCSKSEFPVVGQCGLYFNDLYYKFI
jgi:hypothetical protein